jgi:hypothetical protein
MEKKEIIIFFIIYNLLAIPFCMWIIKDGIGFNGLLQNIFVYIFGYIIVESYTFFMFMILFLMKKDLDE